MPTGAELLKQAVQLSQAGGKKQAAQILARLLKQEQDNEEAWWWLAACVDPPQQKLDCLQRVLRINPLHSGARFALLRLQANLPLPDPSEGGEPEEPKAPEAAEDPANAPTGRLGVTTLAQYQTLLSALQTDPKVEQLIVQAAQAEALDDFQAAYNLYDQALAIDSSHTLAWLGKGYAAARLSTPAYNGIPEFFECLTRAVLSRDRYGLTLNQALSQLDPEIAAALIDRLCKLSPAIARLAGSSPPAMANVFAIERVRLADCAYAAGLCLEPRDDRTSARAELAGVAVDAFSQVIASVRETTYSTRSRRELILTFRGFMLSHLTASELNQDPAFLRQVDSLIENE